jgi:hypothetical protein
MDEEPFSVEAAQTASQEGRLAGWVADFLSSPGSDNEALAAHLSEQPGCWRGPVLVPLNQLHRLAGPEGEPVLRVVDDDEWRDDVEEMKDEIEEGWDPPPLIVSYRRGQLVLEDGNHRVESLRRAGAREGWAVLHFEDPAEWEQFGPVPSRRLD